MFESLPRPSTHPLLCRRRLWLLLPSHPPVCSERLTGRGKLQPHTQINIHAIGPCWRHPNVPSPDRHDDRKQKGEACHSNWDLKQRTRFFCSQACGEKETSANSRACQMGDIGVLKQDDCMTLILAFPAPVPDSHSVLRPVALPRG
jgi:hypothetical protein